MEERINELGQFEELIIMAPDVSAGNFGIQAALLMGKRAGMWEVLNYDGKI